ncbi:uncharacterized protein LOC133530573 [Cydia pomonella]|uniref:uncharacterized protein LOC133525113 n=2 Tax=Cydia pomonella TaxID=82600 RepID=UPI002ADE1B93|nr:uncharacterized protein LOC133525113 [Cydia pomonella]XP_061724521.1 uncharacterized protein LOC133530573 [Cydia pomonella]
MAKPIRSSVRSMLFTIISNYNQVRHDENERLLEKKRILDEIIQATAGVDDENVRETIEKLARELKNVIDNNASESSYLEKVSTMTGVSIRTLRTIKKEGSINQGQWNTPGKKRPRPPTVSNLDNFDVSAIRNKINEFYCVKKQVPTLRALHADLKESIGFSGCCETLRKILHENGFEFKKNKEERSILMEKFEISGWRQRFLRAIHKKRQEGKKIVYLDETYVHQNYRPKKSWQGPSTSGLVEKISSGKRHIIVHAGSEQGFVPNALLVFSTKSKAADYHDDMNSSNFLKWLREMLIPNLSEPSIIVMDNASYHVTQINKPPTMHSLKADIQKWLRENNIPYEACFKKEELMCLVEENKIGPIYAAEELLKQHGHEVLKLPPYHCDLNAIELIWSLTKRKIASSNVGLPGSDTENLIRECFAMITPEDWKKCTDHVINVERKYKSKDNITDTELAPFIIEVRESDNDSDSSLSGIEFLESDFDYES